MKNILTQFIPIIVLYLLLSFSNEFTLIAHTVLGKLVAVFIVIYYTLLDKKVGLLVCSLIILYYQNEMIENMLNMDDMMKNMFEQKTEGKEKVADENMVEGMQNNECSKNKGISTTETMSNLESSYNSENRVKESFEQIQNKDEYPEEFRKQYCEGNILKYKDMNVRGDMIEHVFPEVNYKQDKCNPCDGTCDFSIIEKRMKTETEMIPKFSKDEK
jgi:hypothetical protein